MIYELIRIGILALFWIGVALCHLEMIYWRGPGRMNESKWTLRSVRTLRCCQNLARFGEARWSVTRRALQTHNKNGPYISWNCGVRDLKAAGGPQLEKRIFIWTCNAWSTTASTVAQTPRSEAHSKHRLTDQALPKLHHQRSVLLPSPKSLLSSPKTSAINSKKHPAISAEAPAPTAEVCRCWPKETFSYQYRNPLRPSPKPSAGDSLVN